MFLKKTLICVNNENFVRYLDFESCLVYKITKWKVKEFKSK